MILLQKPLSHSPVLSDLIFRCIRKFQVGNQIVTALLYLRIILRGTAANGIFPIVPVSNQSSRQNGNKSQCPTPFFHSRLSSTDGLRFSQSVHSKEGR